MSLLLTNQPISVKGNQPAPAINRRIQQTLTEMGGLVPAEGGHFAGMPVYRLAWGMEEKHFERGKMRIRFCDPQTEPIIVQERFYVAPEIALKVLEWIQQRQQTLREKFLNFEFNVFAEHIPLSQYLRENVSSLEYIELPVQKGTREEIEMEYLGIAAVSAPADWLFLCDVREVIEIGKPFWYVMRWIPARKHGGREHWEENRYEINAYVPELNDILPIVDERGAFPEYGFWIPRLEIADYQQKNGTYHWLGAKYAEPTEENCLTPIAEEIFAEKSRNLSPLGVEQFKKDRNHHDWARKQKFEKGVNEWVHNLLEVEPDKTLEEI